MLKILPIVIGAFFWAWLTQKSTYGKYDRVKRQTTANRIVFFLLVLTLALPSTLCTSYNDTGAYIRAFMQAKPLGRLLASGELHMLRNPMFVIYQSLVKTFTNNHIIFFLIPAFFVQYSYLRFIRRHCDNFLFGVFLYICLGTYIFSLAAMKQTIAMAILLYAVEFLIDRKYGRFFLTVFLAFTFHTYALCFVVLPLFTVKPWTPRTWLMLLAVAVVIANFNTVISSFLDFVNESGKSLAEEEVIGTAGINPIRVMVYAVTPLFALFFRRYLYSGPANRERYILTNMSVLTVSIMSLGLVNAANMFARMGQYFEVGLICSLPWMIEKPFEKSSMRLIYLLAIVCFVGFFCYANLVQIVFDDHFGRYTIAEAVQYLIRNP